MDWQKTIQRMRQFSLPHTRALRQELDQVRAEHVQVTTELTQVRAEYASALESDHQQIAALQLQVSHIEADRDQVRRQSQLLETTLAEAGQRQQRTEERIRVLEAQLDDARHQHESNLYLTRDVLQRMQADQKNLMSLQSDMVRTFSETGSELLRSLRDQARPRYPLWQVVAMAGLLFLSGALGSALVLRDAGDHHLDLTAIREGISDLARLMQAHSRSHEELLDKLSRALQRPAPAETPGTAPPDRHGSVSPGQPPSGQPTPGPAADPANGPAGALQPPGKRARHDLQTLGLLSGSDGDAADAATGRHAMRKFLLLYRQAAEPAVEQGQLLHDFAVLARGDARRYHVDSAVVAAIRLASLRTGVDFPYLMELASIESSFNPQARAHATSASGLYQFKKASWLEALRKYGKRYGLGALVSHINLVPDDHGHAQPRMADTGLQQRALKLRFDPHYAALMAAEKVRDSRARLQDSLDREPRRTDLYLTHFFGTSGAISFLKALDSNPDQIADEIFPGAARHNGGIFRKHDHKPRTVVEIYQLLRRRFNTDRFDEG
jgi:soluble lytic murein transglycosylase-like protein